MQLKHLGFLLFIFTAAKVINAQVKTKITASFESQLSYPLASFSNAQAVAVPRYTFDISHFCIQQHLIFSKKIGI